MASYTVTRMMVLLGALVMGVHAMPLCAGEALEQKTNEQFTVELTDGSSIVCRPKLDVLPLKTSFAELKIPLQRMETLKLDPETNVAALSLLNGDRLQGECLLEEITVSSVLGDLVIPLAHVATLTTTIKRAPVFEDSPSKRNACINHLRQMDSAKEQWAMASRKSNGDAVDERSVNAYIKGNSTPICPAGGTYTYNTIGANPQCNVPGHSLR